MYPLFFQYNHTMKRNVILLLLLFVLPLRLSAKKYPNTPQNKITNEKEKKTHQNARDVYKRIENIKQQKIDAFENYLQEMPLEEKICQLFIENLEGNTTFKPVEHLRDISDNPEIPEDSYIIPGGYLFFSFNIGKTPEQIMTFTDSIHEFCLDNKKNPPFLAIDQEGGYVNRLRKINGPLPSAQEIADTLDSEKAEQLYEMQALQMKLLGFHVNLAPVVEICTDSNRDFLAERSFGDAENVVIYGTSAIMAYENNSIGTVLKHFPGNTNTDPHTGLPEIKLNEKELYESLEPFGQLIKLNPSGILMSHARTEAVDGEVPSCLSHVWVTEILRNKYGYDGIIFSDDIFMGALASNGYFPEKAVVMAVEAGIDCIMISEKRILKPARVLYKTACDNPEFAAKIDAAVKRIQKFKSKVGLLELTDDGKGGYMIVTDSMKDFSPSSLPEKLELFNKEKERNTEFIKMYFAE